MKCYLVLEIVDLVLEVVSLQVRILLSMLMMDELIPHLLNRLEKIFVLITQLVYRGAKVLLLLYSSEVTVDDGALEISA